ncbi:MAG: cation-translocating P-type ATPase, partial [Planctomycetes bacterium]|nr:cation-translocating P-type ATPase [Planctomycetota bacterium]
MTTLTPSIEEEALTMRIDGMTCGHCAQGVRKAIERVPSVTHAEVNHSIGIAKVYGVDEGSRFALNEAVKRAGFKPIVEENAEGSAARLAARAKREMRLLLWSLAWSLPVMIIHMGGMMHSAWGMWTVFVCATVLQPTSAITFYIGAIKSLRTRRTDMNVLVSMGILSGYCYAVLATFLPDQFGHAS